MNRKSRNKRGASMIVIVLVMAFLILLPLGIVGWEVLRFSLAQQQLRSCCDAAALSGAAAIASGGAPGVTIQQQQEAAMRAALQTLRMNFVYNDQLDNAVGNENPQPPVPGTPAPGEVVVNLVLLDQTGKQVNTGDPAAKSMRIDAYYGYLPPLAKSFGFGPIVVNAFSEGGLPQLDLVLCFDISGSMDDQTPITFVKRWWNGTNVQYDVPQSPVPAHGKLFGLQEPPETGTRVNCVPPQNLDFAKYPKNDNGNLHPFTFYPELRHDINNGVSEVGQPPGNKTDGSVDPNKQGDLFTDMVVNLDGQTTFGGNITSAGLAFDNLGDLVESGRGNYNTQALIDAAVPNNKMQLGPNAGNALVSTKAADANYKATYLALAKKMIDPMYPATQAAISFFTTMNAAANCHFGFVAFSDGIGSSPTSVWGTQPKTTVNNITAAYTAGGTGNFPMPLIRLKKDDSQFAACNAAIDSLVATGKTDIATSLNEAIYQLSKANNLTRDKARRAIILFTDGEPNLPTDGNPQLGANSFAANQAYAAAELARQANIPIYAVGLSQNPAIEGTQRQILERITSTTGGTVVIVNNAAQLQEAFEVIVRALVILK